MYSRLDLNLANRIFLEGWI